MFLIGLLFLSNQSSAQTTVFSDDFNRAILSPGGIPAMNYTIATTSTTGTLTTPATGVGVNDFAGNPDSKIRIAGGTSVGRETVMGTMTGVPGYNTTLQSNTQVVTWSFNIKHNRSTTTMSGFNLPFTDPTTGTTTTYYGVGAVLACDKQSPLDAAAKGYAVVMGGVGTKNTYDLVSFQNGMGATANLTIIIAGIPMVNDIRDIVSVNVTYNKLSGKWNMFQRNEGGTSTSAYPNPYGLSFPGSGIAGIGEVDDTAAFVNVALPFFGLIFNHGATAVTFNFDNYKVTLGQASTANFYVTAGSDCSNLNNWWANQNGTGAHPTSFNADAQVFNIFSTGVTIGSDLFVVGGGSKVVIGNGTDPVSLTVTETAFLAGTVKLAANSTLTINHLTVFPSFESGGVDATSNVIFNGTAAQNVPGSTYGNLSILTQGIEGAKAIGAISVLGNLNIDANAILSMDASKLTSVNTLSGTGALKTKFAFSGALPDGIVWPYSIFYNFTSANTVQTIALGTFINLDTTGGVSGSPRNFPNDISVSGSLITGLGAMTAANRITLDGTAAQTIQPNFPPATALVITNASTAGVSLSAENIVPDNTSLELAGNMNADYNENFDTLSLIDNSTLILGATPHFVAFASSSSSNPGPADFWTPGKTLTIKGWTGAANASGTNGKVFFGLDTTGLTATQLAQITFDGYSGASLLSTGEVVPTLALNINSNGKVNFKYFPNPVKDKLTLSNLNPISQVTIYNLIGQKVLSVSPNKLETSIDISSFSASTYFVEVVANGQKSTVKVIKQ